MNIDKYFIHFLICNFIGGMFVVLLIALGFKISSVELTLTVGAIISAMSAILYAIQDLYKAINSNGYVLAPGEGKDTL